MKIRQGKSRIIFRKQLVVKSRKNVSQDARRLYSVEIDTDSIYNKKDNLLAHGSARLSL